MTPEEAKLKPRSIMRTIHRFLGGCVLAILLLLIPYTITSIELNPLNLGVASSLVLLCGILASVLGQSFLEALTRSLESSGFW